MVKNLKYLDVVKNNYSIVILIFILGILVYFNSLSGSFLWDDEIMVLANESIRSLDIYKIFSSSAFGGAFSGSSFYRPFQILSYAFDFYFWGLNPLGFHLTNVLLHCLTAVFCFFIGIHLFKSKIKACVFSIIFLVHPMGIECVSYISGRGDILFLFFLTISILFTFKYEKNSNNIYFYIGSLMFFIASVLSKENGVSYPLVLLTYFFLFHSKNRRLLSLICIQFFLATVFSVYRILATMSSPTATLSNIAYASFYERISTFFWSFSQYIKLLIFPYPLHMEYHEVISTFFSPWFFISILILFFIYGSFKFIQEKRLALFFLAWFFLSLIPVNNIVPTLASTIREHWLYLPQLGFIGYIILLFSSLNLKNKYLVNGCFFVFFLITFSLITINRNRYWTDGQKLFQNDLKYESRSFLLWNNLGVTYFRNQDFGRAKECFIESIKVAPLNRYGVAHNNLGVILENEGKLEEAIWHYKQGIEIENYKLSFDNLIRVYLRLGEFEKSLQIYKSALALYPNDFNTWKNIFNKL